MPKVRSTLQNQDDSQPASEIRMWRTQELFLQPLSGELHTEWHSEMSHDETSQYPLAAQAEDTDGLDPVQFLEMHLILEKDKTNGNHPLYNFTCSPLKKI